MRNTAEQKIKKYRKKRLWPTVVFFLITAFLAMTIIMFSVSVFFSYILDSKYNIQNETVTVYGKMIQTSLNQGLSYDAILGNYALDKDMPEAMCVIDKKGNVLSSYGEQTFHVDMMLEMTVLDEYILFPDEDMMNLVTEDGQLKIDIVEIASKVFEEGDLEMATDSSVEGAEPVLELVVWLPTSEDSNGNRTLVKSQLSLYTKDLLLLF